MNEHTHMGGDNAAILAGYTEEYIASFEASDYHLFVKPDADLNDSIRVWDADECCFRRVNGWIANWQRVEPEWSGSPCPEDPDNFWIRDDTGERIPAN